MYILQKEEKAIGIDWYSVFFIILAVAIFCPLIASAGAVIMCDAASNFPESLLGKIAMFLLSSLGSTTIMMNLGDNNASAKEIFWAWIIFSAVLIIAGIIGFFEIWLYRLITG